MTVTSDVGCSYCGLPVPNGTRSDENAPAAQYCCYGCRVAATITGEEGEEGQARWQLTRLGIAIFCTMNVMVFTLVLWSRDVYQDEALSTSGADALFELLRYASLLLTGAVVVLLGMPLIENAVETLSRGRITTDLLIVAGVVAATIYSLVSVITHGQHTYFEVACMVLVAVTIGRWLEATGKLKTTNAIRSLEKLLPETARLVKLDGVQATAEQSVPLASIAVGQHVRVLPGERIPLDGVVQQGQGAIDEKIVTGESIPSVKEMGDAVFAGTLNLESSILVEVTAVTGGGALQRIVDAVTAAATAKSKLQTLADRIVTWFVPSVALVAGTTLVVRGLMFGVGDGLMTALAVVLIACPCGLGIATPLAIWAAMGRAGSDGVLFRDGNALQRLATTRAICFDKTGTLTTGECAVDTFVADPEVPPSAVLVAAAALSASSTHVFAQAIRRHADHFNNHTPLPCPVDAQVQLGRGIVGKFEPAGETYHLGSVGLMKRAEMDFPPSIAEALAEFQQAAKPLTCIGWGGRVRGAFAFQEAFRPEAPGVLQSLEAKRYQLHVLTGDYAERATWLAAELGVPVSAQLLPEQKCAAIREMRRDVGSVVMVGDGINDAPAMAEADVGIAMGCGADVTRETASVCLVGDNLEQIEGTIELAKSTMRTVRQNLFWAFSYNCIGVALAVLGLLNPIWAALAMVGSSLFVVSNSLRLTGHRLPSQREGHVAPRHPDIENPASLSAIEQHTDDSKSRHAMQ